MRLDFFVRRHANFFHFVSHLAHTPSHPYRIAWLKETGSLNEAEEKALKDFTQLMKRYPFDEIPPERYLQKPFTWFEKEHVWEEVWKWVDTPSDFEQIKQIFATLEPRFEKIWKSDQPLLVGWEKELRRLIPLDVHARVAQDLHMFHQSVTTGENLDVYLLFSLSSQQGGSAVVGTDRITVQCSKAPKNDWGHDRVLWTLYHEWTHNFQWDYLYPLIKDFAKEIDATEFNQSKAARESEDLIGFFIEVLARWIGSYIYRRHYPQIQDSFGIQPSQPQQLALRNLVVKYIEGKKPVDVKFLSEFWQISRDANYDVL